ncbi:MAG: hypothetical protein WD079_05085 [Phycisphaeraceae bacterium]
MKTFVARRWTLLTVALLAAALLLTAFVAYHLRLHQTAFASGWILLAMMLFLAGYNLRKKLRLFPLLPTSYWLQAHIYVGLLAVVVFAWHTGLRLPRGPLEASLAAAYLLTTATGIFGLWLSRAVPPRLTTRGQEVIYERIPAMRRTLRERAERLAVEAVEESRSTVLADFYEQELADFFAGGRDRLAHLLQSARPLRKRLSRLDALRRYVNREEAAYLDDLSEMVRAKDALDYHQVMQGLLKGWLFVHVPITWALLLLIAVHMVAVHAFSGAL